MLEIDTIAKFQELPLPLQLELQKALRTKNRLDDFLDSLNKADAPAPPVVGESNWMECGRCTPLGFPGWVKRPELRDPNDIHPSQITKCAKTLWYACNGHTDKAEDHIPPRLRLIFDIGHKIHDMLQGYGRRGAWCNPEEYKEEAKIDPDAVSPIDGVTPLLPLAHKYWIRGAADAVIDKYICRAVPGLGDVSVKVVHEYKSINSNGFTKLTRPKPEHKFQATIYSAMFDAPLVVFLYLNKDTQNTADFPVPFDHTIWNEIVTKIDLVQTYTNQGEEIPWPETSAVKNPSECMSCAYRKHCAPPVSNSKAPARR